MGMAKCLLVSTLSILTTAPVLPAFFAFYDAAAADTFNKIIAHIRQCCVPVHTMLVFHLPDAVFYKLQFVFSQFQFFDDRTVVFDQFGGGKTRRDAGAVGMVRYLVNDRVNASVNRAGSAEVSYRRVLLFFCCVYGCLNQLGDPFIFRRADRYDRNAKFLRHFFNVYRTVVCPHFIHHVQRQHHGYMHLHKLECQIQVSLQICGVHNVDDAIRLLV